MVRRRGARAVLRHAERAGQLHQRAKGENALGSIGDRQEAGAVQESAPAEGEVTMALMTSTQHQDLFAIDSALLSKPEAVNARNGGLKTAKQEALKSAERLVKYGRPLQFVIAIVSF